VLSLRQQRQPTSERFAELVGISLDLLSLIERGINAPSFRRLIRLPILMRTAPSVTLAKLRWAHGRHVPAGNYGAVTWRWLPFAWSRIVAWSPSWWKSETRGSRPSIARMARIPPGALGPLTLQQPPAEKPPIRRLLSWDSSPPRGWMRWWLTADWQTG